MHEERKNKKQKKIYVNSSIVTLRYSLYCSSLQANPQYFQIVLLYVENMKDKKNLNHQFYIIEGGFKK